MSGSSTGRTQQPDEFRPLADRMRPRNLDEFVGQRHLVGPGKPLRRTIESAHLHSMVLWGPPGTGKTTLARIIANHCDAAFVSLSAVTAGVAAIRDAVERARRLRREQGRATVLFVDEVHRFNKAQQDAFLPHVEDGTLFFIGATTENPSFELNGALLSRVRVYVLKPLSVADIRRLVDAALTDDQRGLGARGVHMTPELRDLIAQAADGDARRALNFLELAVDLAAAEGEPPRVSRTHVEEAVGASLRRFDKGGDVFYDQISALHKAVRGSAPDAALYWFCRMVDGGADPRYVARRVIRMASEDIGNADPRGLALALDAAQAYERLGSPEGELAIAQAILYLACAAKSNAVYKAYNAAMEDARSSGSLEVPVHLRNAPTRLMRALGYGKAYRYAHDEPDAYAAGETYLPSELEGRRYYEPVDRGLERRIREKLQWLREQDRAARSGTR